MKKLFMQIIQFVGISGIGWIIDFAIFNLLNIKFNGILINNMISSGIAVCFVFFVSTRKTFTQKLGGLNLRWKFMIYIIYQIILIYLMSRLLASISGLLLAWLVDSPFVDFVAMISKILVTPITMCLNFVVMKFVIERI